MDINKSQPEKQQEFPTKIDVNEGEDNPLWADMQESEQNKKDKIVEEGKRLDEIRDMLDPKNINGV